MTTWGIHSALAVLSLSFNFSAGAFQLTDHQRITEQAIAEFKLCFPQFNTSLDADQLVQADLDEDTNLIEKELFYSHFYHPEKKLNLLWREDSSGRIANLKPELLQCRQAGGAVTASDLDALGHAIHHFQDMAVPAHVVPVNHSLWDGFESYAVSGDISSDWNCAEIAATNAGEVESILKETATETLNTVRSEKVEAAINGSRKTLEVSLIDFWQEAGDSGFGDYGSIGNHFGESQVDFNGKSLTISDNFYREFKRLQLKRAVRATLRGLAWSLTQ